MKKNDHYARRFMGYAHWFFYVKGSMLLKTEGSEALA